MHIDLDRRVLNKSKSRHVEKMIEIKDGLRFFFGSCFSPLNHIFVQISNYKTCFIFHRYLSKIILKGFRFNLHLSMV